MQGLTTKDRQEVEKHLPADKMIKIYSLPNKQFSVPTLKPGGGRLHIKDQKVQESMKVTKWHQIHSYELVIHSHTEVEQTKPVSRSKKPLQDKSF